MVRNLNLYGTSRGRTPVTGFHHLGANACLGGIQGGGAQDLGQHQILALKPWISTFFQSWPKNLFSTQVYLEIAFKCHQKCFWVRAPPTWVSPRLSWRCNGLKSIQIWARKLLFKTHPEQNKTTFKCIEMRVRADKTNIALWFSPVQVVRSCTLSSTLFRASQWGETQEMIATWWLSEISFAMIHIWTEHRCDDTHLAQIL